MSTGKKPQQLEDIPVPPDSLLYLWEWYTKMAQGLEVLTWTEMLSWSQLHGITLTITEVEMLRKIDSTYRSHYT